MLSTQQAETLLKAQVLVEEAKRMIEQAGLSAQSGVQDLIEGLAMASGGLKIIIQQNSLK